MKAVLNSLLWNRNAESTASLAGGQQGPASTLITPPSALPSFLALGVLLYAYPPVAEGISESFSALTRDVLNSNLDEPKW